MGRSNVQDAFNMNSRVSSAPNNECLHRAFPSFTTLRSQVVMKSTTVRVYTLELLLTRCIRSSNLIRRNGPSSTICLPLTLINRLDQVTKGSVGRPPHTCPPLGQSCGVFSKSGTTSHKHKRAKSKEAPRDQPVHWAPDFAGDVATFITLLFAPRGTALGQKQR